jgi:hypothetical protein
LYWWFERARAVVASGDYLLDVVPCGVELGDLVVDAVEDGLESPSF